MEIEILAENTPRKMGKNRKSFQRQLSGGV